MVPVFLLLCFVPTEGRRSQAGTDDNQEIETATYADIKLASVDQPNKDEFVWNKESRIPQYWNPFAKQAGKSKPWAGGDAKTVQGTIGGKRAKFASVKTMVKNRRNKDKEDYKEDKAEYSDKMKAIDTDANYALVLGLNQKPIGDQCEGNEGVVGFALTASYENGDFIVRQNINPIDMTMKQKDFFSMMKDGGGTLTLYKQEKAFKNAWMGDGLCEDVEYERIIDDENQAPVWTASMKKMDEDIDEPGHLCAPKKIGVMDKAKAYINSNSDANLNADGKSPSHKMAIPFDGYTLYMKYTCTTEEEPKIKITKMAVYQKQKKDNK